MKKALVIAQVLRRVKSGFPVLALVGICACSGTDGPETADAVPVAGTVTDSVFLDAVRVLVDAVGSERLFARVAEPSPYLTDFFGIQSVGSVRPKQIIGDLVPDHASVVSQDPNSLTLDFTGGPRVTFRFDTELSLEGNRIETQYARVEIRDSATYPADPVAFRVALQEAGVAETYLVANPYFAAEQAVSTRMRDASSIEVVALATDTAGIGVSPHAAIVVGDAAHGEVGPYETVRAMLESPSIDWLAIEMLAEDKQPALDRFLADPEDGVWDAARSVLLAYYDTNWNSRGIEVTADPAENPYFRLIERARSLGKRVIALDAESSYTFFRFGEFPLGSTVRDFVWATNVPDTGRGVVYGGSSHFLPTRRPNMLTFLRERFPEIALFEDGAAN